MTTQADNHCPVCRSALWASEDEPISEKTCPRCGAELWALAGSRGPVFVPRRAGESEFDYLVAVAGPLLGVSAEQMERVLKGADDLDLVEIVMDVEEALRSGDRQPG